MSQRVDDIPESWLSRLGGDDASGWLSAFIKQPADAVADLLWDNFYFGPLNPTNRWQLLSAWLDLLGNSERFAERLDAELTAWVAEHWGRFTQDASSLISAWSCLCRVVEASAKLPDDSRLKNCAAALRARFAERRRFLGSFSVAPAADPLGLYLAVLAEFQGADRSLVAFWHHMCALPDGVPFYHARYAMLGLRRLQAVDQAERGTLRVEIVMGLLQLVQAFNRLIRERGLDSHLAERTFKRVASQTAAAYPDSRRWVEHGLAPALKLAAHEQKWLNVIPPLAKALQRPKDGKGQGGQRPRRTPQFDPSWPGRVSRLATRLRSGDRGCLPEVKKLLDEQRSYAEATGNTDEVVRALSNFASRALNFNPKLSLRWAEEARQLAPHDGVAWDTVRKILLKQGNLTEALNYAWVAWKRFPEDVVTHTGLAEVLKARRRYDEAEAIYRRAVDRFPANVVSRNGLADLLKDRRRYDEAMALYRETIERFPDDFVENVIARNGLAGTLQRSGRPEAAEAEYRRSIEAGYVNTVTFIGLAQLLLRKGEANRAEALALVRQALRLDPRDHYAQRLKQQLEPAGGVTLNDLIKEWEKTADDVFGVQEPTPEENKVWSDEADAWSDEPEAASNEGPEQPPPLVPETEAVDELLTHSAGEEAAVDVSEPTPPAKESPPALIEREPVTDEAEQPNLPTRQAVLGDEQGVPDEAKAPPPEVRRLESSLKQTPPRAGKEVPSARGDMKTTKREGASPVGPKQQPPLEQKPSGEAAPRADATGATEPESPLAPSDSFLLAALVAEAYFYRTWAKSADPKVRAARRRHASELLAQADRLFPGDAQVVAERVALTAESRGEFAAANQSLTEQIGSQPAAAPLLVLKARMEREMARMEKRPLNDSTLAELCLIPHRLRDLDRTLAPLFHFQRGLAALALRDGDDRKRRAADAFSRFRKTLRNRAATESMERGRSNNKRLRETPRFHEWLQTQVNLRVFAGLREAEDLSVDLNDILFLDAKLEERRPAIEEVEDVFADRLTFGTL